jgi:toxin ParE1/3/4
MGEREYRLSPKAVRDLENIWAYIADHNEAAADRVLEAIRLALVRATEYPRIGSPRPSLYENARLLIVKRYLIVYIPADYGIHVVTVTHGSKPPEINPEEMQQ